MNDPFGGRSSRLCRIDSLVEKGYDAFLMCGGRCRQTLIDACRTQQNP